jgi:hypothetical protein
MEKNIQQMIWEVVERINSQKGNLDPVLLSENLVELSILYGNLTQHIADLDNIYQSVIGLALDKDPSKPYNKIENECKRGDEYYKLKKALAMEKMIIQVIRASNKYLRLKEHEQEASKYQT